jgi:aminoglycoside phosphotransferase (APT) family kinase protein
MDKDTTNPMDENTPCSACGWTAEQQRHCFYKSSVKLFYGASDRGAWSLGSKFVLKERSSKRVTLEPANVRLVQHHTTIPVASVVAEWTEPADGAHFTLAERVPGMTLADAWPQMSADDKERVAEQTAALLQQLRSLHAPRLQSDGGGPLYDHQLFRGDGGLPHGPFASDAELWAAMEPALAAAPAAARQRLRDRMPPCAPYTFTHGDLNYHNIMVDVATGKVTGILDWELSGYFPVWWEYASSTTWGCSAEDADWRFLLRKHLEPFEEAREWWFDFMSLERYPEINARAEALLRDDTDDE